MAPLQKEALDKKNHVYLLLKGGISAVSESVQNVIALYKKANDVSLWEISESTKKVSSSTYLKRYEKDLLLLQVKNFANEYHYSSAKRVI